MILLALLLTVILIAAYGAAIRQLQVLLFEEEGEEK